ncbi:hypothetical protein [Streptomyces sp. NPDC005131]
MHVDEERHVDAMSLGDLAQVQQICRVAVAVVVPEIVMERQLLDLGTCPGAAGAPLGRPRLGVLRVGTVAQDGSLTAPPLRGPLADAA